MHEETCPKRWSNMVSPRHWHINYSLFPQSHPLVCRLFLSHWHPWQGHDPILHQVLLFDSIGHTSLDSIGGFFTLSFLYLFLSHQLGKFGLKAGSASFKFAILLCLCIINNRARIRLSFLQLLLVWTTTAKNDQVSFKLASCMTEPALEIWQFDIFSVNFPHIVNGVKHSNVIKNGCSCTSICNKPVTQRYDWHANPTARFLACLVFLLAYQDTL